MAERLEGFEQPHVEGSFLPWSSRIVRSRRRSSADWLADVSHAVLARSRRLPRLAYHSITVNNKFRILINS